VRCRLRTSRVLACNWSCRNQLAHANRLAVLVFAVGFSCTLPGCSFLREQVAVTRPVTASIAIAPGQQGAARDQCSVECSNRYGK